jgi:hypothetical protein
MAISVMFDRILQIDLLRRLHTTGHVLRSGCYLAHSFLDSLILEDGTDRMYENVGKELPLYAAKYPRRGQISSTSRRKSNDMIYLLTSIGLSPDGRSTVYIYTQTIHRTIQNNQYIEQHNNWRVRAVPHLG